MNGTISQLVALTCHANAHMRGLSVGRFFPVNSTCQFCEYVNFVRPEKNWLGKLKEKEIARTPDDWFEYLKSRNAQSLRLAISPQNNPNISDRNSAGFVGGGGYWTIEIILPNQKSEFWIARWLVGNQDAPDQRIWRVSYTKAMEDRSSGKVTSLKDAIPPLIESLEAVSDFSRRNDCGGFTECFERALDTIRTGTKHGYHRDLSPAGVLSPEAEGILDACQSAWVFGGMGSWNDMGFSGEVQSEYELVSDQLFINVKRAIVASANTSEPLGIT